MVSFFVSIFLDAKATIFFRESEDIPIEKVHFHLLNCGSPNKVSLSPISNLENFTENRDVLHNVGGDAAEERFGKNDPVSHIKELDFSSREFGVKVIHYELEFPIVRFGMKDKEA